MIAIRLLCFGVQPNSFLALEEEAVNVSCESMSVSVSFAAMRGMPVTQG
ncbi:hypothetical protein P8900_00920 [Bacillus haynesii]|nr:hypothetical protein [Bacillus haynesii]